MISENSAITHSVRRARSAFASRDTLGRQLLVEALKLGHLARTGRFGAFLGSAVELGTDRNPYYELRTRDARYRVVEIQDHTMILDADDEGICRTLLAYGVHEHLSTEAFKRELRRLSAELDGPATALEVGANVGYFCLLEADILGDSARIYAVEPAPANVQLLRGNVALNGYEDVVTIERCAFGRRTEPVELELSARSNRHAVRPARGDGGTAAKNPDDSDVHAVEQVSGERFLAERGVDPEEVNVVRMDVEGYESDVVAGMREVFTAPGPTLAHFELHPLLMSDVELDGILDLLADNGFEVVSAVRTEAAVSVPDGRRWRGLSLSADDFGDVRRAVCERDYAIELIVRK